MFDYTEIADGQRPVSFSNYNHSTSVVNWLKLTCHHINRRHICFNIKSISVHPLLWMNVMLDFIFVCLEKYLVELLCALIE